MTSDRLRYVFHIGFHKTGSSALQEYMFAAREINSRNGILYPLPICGLPSHGELPWSLSPEMTPWANGVYQFESVWQHHVRTIEDTSRSSGSHTAVFSSEDFSLLAEAPFALKFFREHIGDIDAWIVVSLRSPIDYLVSWYLHAVRTQATTAMPKDVGSVFPWNSLEYCRRLRPWADLFGRDRIVIVPYSGDIVGTYCRVFGLGEPTNNSVRRINIGVHPWLVETFLALPQGPEGTKARAALERISEYGPKVDAVVELGLRTEVIERAIAFEADLKQALADYSMRELPPVNTTF